MVGANLQRFMHSCALHHPYTHCEVPLPPQDRVWIPAFRRARMLLQSLRRHRRLRWQHLCSRR